MRIVIADQMEEEVVDEIRKLGQVDYKPSDVKKALVDADVLIVRSATKVTKELVSDATKLRVVARAGVGLDNVDQQACKDKKIKVLNTPGASSNAVAELALGLIMSMMRNVQKAHHQMKNGKWDKKNLIGSEVAGKTLGVVGYGRIGSMLGKKAQALGMSIIAYNPPPRITVEGIEYIEDIADLFSKADIISLHVPATNETKNLINKQNIAKMKDGVFIVNTSRGEIIDEDALYEGCKSGKIAGAALDVFCNEPYTGRLLELENVCFTPHLGASTKEAQVRIGQELVALLQAELNVD
ncbi:Glyoxylate reductase [Candidatus Bilamarchaeum dharawalense]|uniref:Glyoxylate reductase n=1 Tax=Candidatus Bilamarchaeum dharawalense TaxID=2885759 RepID=A0A5E4LWX0_9ARCH|nr:Glyoxylate reductase [Candidatus Bilamarchaeum dharawalense]